MLTHSMPRTGWLPEIIITYSASARRAAVSPAGSSFRSSWAAFITDAKGELFERLSPYFRQHGFYVKAVNFLDMEHSDGWNCLYGLDTQPQLVQTVANTIVQNTSGPKEANDF